MPSRNGITLPPDTIPDTIQRRFKPKNLMNVLFDHQIFTLQKFGGISRYFVEIMKRMPDDINVNNSTLLSDNFFLKTDAYRERKTFSIPLLKKRTKTELYLKVNDWKTLHDLREKKSDLFHPTYFNPYFLKALKTPYVMTVHDMIYERFPDLFDKSDPTIAQKKETITRADKIIAISECTKKDVMDIYGIPAERIEVIYHGHSIDPKVEQPVKGLPEHYLLYVGQRFHYKNFNRFLQAFAQIHAQYPEMHLICTGKKFSRNETELISRLGLSGYVSCRFVNDKELAYLYSHALCFVFPSLYEGFGIPILEAYESKCPVALSNASCFPEIAGDAARYFDPYDIDSMAATISEILSDARLRSEMIDKGLHRVKGFSWEKTALQTAALYRSMT